MPICVNEISMNRFGRKIHELNFAFKNEFWMNNNKPILREYRISMNINRSNDRFNINNEKYILR